MIGIYKITNMINGKMYIGQSIDIERRWKEHRNFNNNKEKNKPLYNAFKKYGINNFVFEVETICNEEELDDLETYYISFYNTYVHSENSNGYNITLGGSGSRGYVASEETKIKISNSTKGENHYNYGKHLSEEHKKKLSELRKGKYIGEDNPNYNNHSLKGRMIGENNPMYGKHHNEETKQKIREANSIKIICVTTGEVFNSAKEAGDKYNRNRTNITKVCKHKAKSAGKLPDGTKLVWMYYDEWLQLNE